MNFILIILGVLILIAMGFAAILIDVYQVFVDIDKKNNRTFIHYTNPNNERKTIKIGK